MKQFTITEQTAKLIALGFEKPMTLVDKYYDFDAEAYTDVKAYSIGELIGMLPKNIAMQREEDKWKVSIGDVSITKAELIDALFELLTH